jgi:hypothetical protein
MTKTVCDRCGRECVNYQIQMRLEEKHTTNQGEDLGCSGYTARPIDLCDVCKEALATWMGRDLGLMGEEALVQLKIQREAERRGYEEMAARPVDDVAVRG